mmetsp:Transcript_18254/g.41498  ORF Transcript_18254/g.41498 Transcript_18254/m.41498 type:complete len:141 (+) Transcript_18254:957-1379(+)
MQNLKNLSTDMERAFAREWVARPELSISAKVSYKSRNTTAATFRGSLLQEKALGGQKYDIPSLTKLHFDDDELTGTIEDAKAIFKYDVHRSAKQGRPPRQETPKKVQKDEEEKAEAGGKGEERNESMLAKIVTSVEEVVE